MASEDTGNEDLKHRQLEQERLEREALAAADSPADADRHLRRADKAHYLRQKLEEAERADRRAAAEEAERADGRAAAEEDG